MSGRRGSAASRRQLRQNLRRIGWWNAAPRGVNGLGSLLALLAFLAISLGLASGVLATALYAHREEVGRARGPVPAMEGEAPALRWQFANASVGDRVIGRYALEPLVEDAPLPPGVSRWPAPGEAVVSPALHALLTERGVPDRFGREVGHIGREGLASQTELLVYVRLHVPLDLERALPVTTFGDSSSFPYTAIGELQFDRSIVEFWSLSGFLVVLPGVVALVAAARVADSETRRRHLLLARLGADRRAGASIALPRALLPCGVSLVACIALLTAASTVDLTIPFKGNVIDAAVVRGALIPMAAVLVTSHLVAATALTLLIAGQQGRLGAGRLLAPRDEPAWGRTWLLVVVLATQPWIIALSDSAGVRMVATVAAAAVAVVCLPAALATVLRGWSAWRARGNLEAGRAGGFLGWRITNYRSRSLARLTGSVCALVVVVGHAAAVLAMFTGPALEARRTTARIGTSALVASPGPVPVASEDIVGWAHDRGLAAVQVRQSFGPDAVTLAGACFDLQVLNVACSDGALASERPSARLDELLRWYTRGSDEATVNVLPADDDVPSWASGPQDADEVEHVLLLSHYANDLDPVQLGSDAYRDGLVVAIEPFGAGALLGASDLLHKSYWLFVFGVPGVLTLLVVSALTWAAVVIEESKALVRSPLLAERQDVFSAVAAIRIALPIAAGGIAGAVATAWLLAAHVRIGALELPSAFLITTSIASLAVSALSWWAASRLMAAASRQRWAT